MKIPQIAVLDEHGALEWSGSLKEWFRANEYVASDAHYITDQLRPFHDRPSCATIGGGAAPVFYLSLVG